MKRFLPLLALVASVGVYASQQRVAISGGFFTGKDYLAMSDTEKRAYATGAINGMLVAPFFGAPEENVSWLKACTAKMSDEEIAAVLVKYIRDQPGQSSYNLNVLTFNAMKDACPKTR